MSRITPGTEETADGEPVPFIARWNALIVAMIAEPSVKLVAMTAAQYAIYDGCGVYPGNERLARETGYDAETVRKAWGILRGLGMAHRDARSEWDGKRRTADSYTLEIPENWRSLPLYGPSHGRFHCQNCGRAYNPRPGTVLGKDDTVSWYVLRMAFCPPPGRPRRKPGEPVPEKPPGCCTIWLDRVGRKLRDGEGWELFRSARGDDW